ncbi:MAG: hypothetical protein HYX41_07560 [Bdellovibrio sp.]|nr:hypothetical protein [Bdellovibrio sp.]
MIQNIRPQKKRNSVFLLMVISFSTLLASPSKADIFKINLEPIIGYEQVQVVLPTPHSTSRLIYGASATFGVLLLSGELQYTHGTSSESYPTLGLTQTDVGDRARGGIRSGFRLGPLLTLFVRGGVEAYQERIDQTLNGVTTTTIIPITISPYVGAGARASLGGKLYATADVVATIVNINDLTQNRYTASAGVGVQLP